MSNKPEGGSSFRRIYRGRIFFAQVFDHQQYPLKKLSHPATQKHLDFWPPPKKNTTKILWIWAFLLFFGSNTLMDTHCQYQRLWGPSRLGSPDRHATTTRRTTCSNELCFLNALTGGLRSFVHHVTHVRKNDYFIHECFGCFFWMLLRGAGTLGNVDITWHRWIWNDIFKRRDKHARHLGDFSPPCITWWLTFIIT